MTGIEFRLIYYDNDILEYRFTSSNGRFSGQADAYLGYDEIARMVEGLKGFPSKLGDCREFEFGTFDQNFAGGGLRVRFSRTDSAGHCVMDVELRNDGKRGLGTAESVAMRIPIELAALDVFTSELAAIGLNTGAAARLNMAG